MLTSAVPSSFSGVEFLLKKRERGRSGSQPCMGLIVYIKNRSKFDFTGVEIAWVELKSYALFIIIQCRLKGVVFEKFNFDRNLFVIYFSFTI